MHTDSPNNKDCVFLFTYSIPTGFTLIYQTKLYTASQQIPEVLFSLTKYKVILGISQHVYQLLKHF